jgi:predicted phosphodiesterase
MKIQLVSDLHLEFRAFTFKRNQKADAIVIAGDFGPLPGPKVLPRIRQVLQATRNTPTMIVLGNHDYYYSTFADTKQAWKELLTEFPNVHLLDESSHMVGDVMFVGGTLWTDFQLFDPDIPANHAMHYARRGISDFVGCIGHEGRLLDPTDLVHIHARTKSYIQEIVMVEEYPEVVAVTHFMPSVQAISPYWLQNGRPLNPYFCSNCEDLMVPNLKAWLFGHTHTSADVQVGPTRLVCNPRGYSDAENPGFSSQLLVEI